jgi:hypothetical protein
MEFSDLRTQFLELHESAGDLRVVRHGRESYLHMMDAAHQTRINAKYSKASVEVAANTAYESAREAGRVGKRLLARQPMRRLFLVKGGTAAVRGRFRSLVKLAMERAGVVVDGREVENAWFGLLIDRKIDGEVPYYHRYTAKLQCVSGVAS